MQGVYKPMNYEEMTIEQINNELDRLNMAYYDIDKTTGDAAAVFESDYILDTIEELLDLRMAKLIDAGLPPWPWHDDEEDADQDAPEIMPDDPISVLDAYLFLRDICIDAYHAQDLATLTHRETQLYSAVFTAIMRGIDDTVRTKCTSDSFTFEPLIADEYTTDELDDDNPFRWH